MSLFICLSLLHWLLRRRWRRGRSLRSLRSFRRRRGRFGRSGGDRSRRSAAFNGQGDDDCRDTDNKANNRDPKRNVCKVHPDGQPDENKAEDNQDYLFCHRFCLIYLFFNKLSPVTGPSCLYCSKKTPAWLNFIHFIKIE